MPWDTIFSLANGLAFIAWIALILLSRAELLYSVLREGVIGLLCLLYAGALILVMFVLPFAGGGADFATIDGVRAIFATDGGVVIGWVHYLAFDLFVGLWVARRADEIGLSRIVQAPILVATFMLGPLGLLIFLIVRRIHMARTGYTAAA
ncbi:MAG: DUF4281 domain-containing protein [Sphingomonadaceae bacterium]|nr:DUF4281 domain-containing protein [Sphingomonadaceae bacterium]